VVAESNIGDYCMDRAQELLKELRIDRSKTAVRRRRRWPWILGLLLLALLLAWFLLGRGPLPVETAIARAADQGGSASVLDASGYVTARRLATVSAKITGKVAEVLIEEGMRVEADQVLARLEATDADAQFNLAQSQVAAARAQLGEVQANLRLSEQNLERTVNLVERRLLAQAQLDQAQAERNALRARLASVRQQVEVASEQLALARIGVDNTVVRAPFAGVIIAKAAQPGEIVSPISAGGGFTRTGIGTIVDMESLEVQVDVNEAYIGRVQPGQPVEAVLNAYPDWRIPAEVIAIIPAADRAKATVKVRIAMKEKDPRIVPDMGVRVSFLESAQARAQAGPQVGVWVPARALVGAGADAHVFVVVDGTARRVAVQPGDSRDGERLLPAGVEAGQAVILAPPDDLRDGAAVVVASAP
jgi:RND family efflux transporter MFP subunit